MTGAELEAAALAALIRLGAIVLGVLVGLVVGLVAGAVRAACARPPARLPAGHPYRSNPTPAPAMRTGGAT